MSSGCNKCPVMDLGRDSLGLCLHCHQSFRSRSTCSPILRRRPAAGESFLPQDFRTPIMELGFQRSTPFSRRLPQLNVSGLLNRTPFLQTPQTVNAVPRLSGVAGIFGQEIEKVLAIHNSATLSFVRVALIL